MKSVIQVGGVCFAAHVSAVQVQADGATESSSAEPTELDADLDARIRNMPEGWIWKCMNGGSDVPRREGNIHGTCVDIWGKTGDMLNIAIHQKANDLIEPLIKIYKFDPNRILEDGYSASTLATVMENVDAVKILLKNGADPNLSSESSQLPLHAAATEENLEVMTILLETGADPNRRSNHSSEYPLHAAAKDSVESVKLLLEAGANPFAVDENGKTALELAINSKAWYENWAAESGMNDHIQDMLKRLSSCIDVLQSFVETVAPQQRDTRALAVVGGVRAKDGSKVTMPSGEEIVKNRPGATGLLGLNRTDFNRVLKLLRSKHWYDSE